MLEAAYADLAFIISLKRSGTPPKPTADKPLSPSEREIITALERDKGRTLTPQEVALALEQAR